MTTDTLTAIRELDCRSNDGINVQLLWREHDGTVLVAVFDTKTGGSLCLEVGDDERPLDVYHHPYARAAHRRIDPGNSAAACASGPDLGMAASGLGVAVEGAKHERT
jgi:hypothetical protein